MVISCHIPSVGLPLDDTPENRNPMPLAHGHTAIRHFHRHFLPILALEKKLVVRHAHRRNRHRIVLARPHIITATTAGHMRRCPSLFIHHLAGELVQIYDAASQVDTLRIHKSFGRDFSFELFLMFLMNCFSRGRDFLPGVSFGKQFLKGKCRLSTLAGHISCVRIEFRQLHRFRIVHRLQERGRQSTRPGQSTSRLDQHRTANSIRRCKGSNRHHHRAAATRSSLRRCAAAS